MKYLDGPHLSTEVVLTRNNPLHSAPIPAYSPEDMDPSDPFLAVVRASYDAFSLIKSNMDRYPILKRKPPTDKPSYSKTDDS